MNKQDLLEIVDEEITDRKSSPSYDPSEITEEIECLYEIKRCIEDETDMTFTQYSWLSDLVKTHTESNQ